MRYYSYYSGCLSSSSHRDLGRPIGLLRLLCSSHPTILIRARRDPASTTQARSCIPTASEPRGNIERTTCLVVGRVCSLKLHTLFFSPFLFFFFLRPPFTSPLGNSEFNYLVWLHMHPKPRFSPPSEFMRKSYAHHNRLARSRNRTVKKKKNARRRGGKKEKKTERYLSVYTYSSTYPAITEYIRGKK